ncbi:MAG TPA: gamma-glutamyl-gamma-aminobutyrate hydrolase family protein [Myxococcaceae bacterium]|nr:gamma-glutamyl-gamma-aminobutyrate hydrolase family protein [Myxococcaceae bacterium]
MEGGPEILIPSRGGDARSIFHQYLQALEQTCDFDWGKSRYGERYGDEGIAALKKLEPVFVDGPPDLRPAVAVVTSMPGMIIPGEVAKTYKTVERLEAMGCRPVLIPPIADVLFADRPALRDRVVGQMVRMFDGVVGLGGYDIHPHSYGEQHDLSTNAREAIDDFEIRFFDKASEAEAFLFGICRTHQIWNVARGAKMVPDIPSYGLSEFQDQVKYGVSTERMMSMSDPSPEATLDPTRNFSHAVYLRPGSRMARAAQTETLTTNAVNHQAVDINHPAEGLAVTAVTVDPMTQQPLVSGTEDWHTLTVQFHPELTEDCAGVNRLFDTLGRRAHLFRIVKQLRAEGEVPRLERVAEKMRQLQNVKFEANDFEWLERDLAPRLRPHPVDWNALSGSGRP